MNNNKIILFDIDRTLFDNDRFTDLSDDLIVKSLRIAKKKDLKRYKEIFSNYYNNLKNTRNFRPEVFISLICKEFGYSNKSQLLKITRDNSELYNKCVYDDVTFAFEYLFKEYRLGIYSEGFSKFQYFKLKSLNLDNYFDKDLIFIVEAKDTKKVIDKIPKESIVIDDKETICQFLTDNGFRAIWINRKDDRKSDNFKTIYSLLELPAIL